MFGKKRYRYLVETGSYDSKWKVVFLNSKKRDLTADVKQCLRDFPDIIDYGEIHDWKLLGEKLTSFGYTMEMLPHYQDNIHVECNEGYDNSCEDCIIWDNREDDCRCSSQRRNPDRFRNYDENY